MSRSNKKLKLTKTYVADLQPDRLEYSVWDSKCDGLHVRVMPSGHKSYCVFYRDDLGKQRRRSLGKTSIVALDYARNKAQQVIADVSRGHDQFAAMDKRKSTPTLSEVWQEYLRDHAKPKKAKSSVREDQRLWTRHVKPTFGALRITEITEHDIRKWHAKRSKTPYEANRALSLLSGIFSFGQHLVPVNPCKVVQKFPETERLEDLPHSDFVAVIDALDADHDLGAATMIKLLIWTGARRGEALKAQWREFDLNERMWTVPSHHIKGGQRHKLIVQHALPEICVELLSEWKTICPPESKYVFPSPLDFNRQRYDIAAIWKRVRKRTGLSSLRLHDLRHNYATTALRGGASLYQIQHALGHRDIRTTMRYARFSNENRHQVSAIVANSLGKS